MARARLLAHSLLAGVDAGGAPVEWPPRGGSDVTDVSATGIISTDVGDTSVEGIPLPGNRDRSRCARVCARPPFPSFATVRKYRSLLTITLVMVVGQYPFGKAEALHSGHSEELSRRNTSTHSGWNM